VGMRKKKKMHAVEIFVVNFSELVGMALSVIPFGCLMISTSEKNK